MLVDVFCVRACVPSGASVGICVARGERERPRFCLLAFRRVQYEVEHPEATRTVLTAVRIVQYVMEVFGRTRLVVFSFVRAAFGPSRKTCASGRKSARARRRRRRQSPSRRVFEPGVDRDAATSADERDKMVDGPSLVESQRQRPRARMERPAYRGRERSRARMRACECEPFRRALRNDAAVRVWRRERGGACSEKCDGLFALGFLYVYTV